MSDILILNFMETLFGDLSDEDKNLIKSDIWSTPTVYVAPYNC